MIGFFDSGFGGLSVLREVVKRLPQYDYIYLGDSARAPYGPRSFEEVYAYTKEGVEFLFAHGAELVILACNTASSEALRKIQSDYAGDARRKVLGVLVPFAEAAAAHTRNKYVGVLATEGTVRSQSFVREITKIDPSITVFQKACPLLVPLVEAGKHNSKRADVLIREYAAPLLAEKIDTLVLGCTHYGFLEEKIRAVIGPTVHIISERDIVPEKLAEYLKRHPEVAERLTREGSRQFYSTGDLERFEKLGSVFFGSPFKAQAAV